MKITKPEKFNIELEENERQSLEKVFNIIEELLCTIEIHFSNEYCSKELFINNYNCNTEYTEEELEKIASFLDELTCCEELELRIKNEN